MSAQREAERTIYLVNPRSPGQRLSFGSQSLGVPIGLGVVGSMAEHVRNRAGFENEVDIKVIDEELGQLAKPKSGDLVLVSSFSFTSRKVQTLIQEVNNQGAFVVVGGVHSTMAPDDFSKEGGISFRGEAGNSLVFGDLMSQWLNSGVLNRGQKIESEALANPKSINLADLPVSQDIYKALDKNRIVRGTFAVLGCPYNCKFCTVMAGRVVRTRPVGEIVDELKLRGLDKTGFTLYDSNLGAARSEYLHELLDRFSELKIPRGWSVEISIDLLDKGKDQLLDALAKSHCHRLFVGIESSDAQNLEAVGKKHNLAYDSDRVREIVKKAHQRGIKITGLFIAGFPTETIESIRNIEQYIKETKLDDANIFILTPLPGTEIWDELAKAEHFDPQTLDTDQLDLKHLVFKHPLGNDSFLKEYKRLCDRVFSVPAVLSRSTKAFFMSLDHHLPENIKQAAISSLCTGLMQADLHRKLGFIDRANKAYDIWRQLSIKG